MTATLTISAAGATHVGYVRRRNEDAWYVGEHLAAVADGLGGHVGGDVASHTVIEAVRAFDRHVDPGELSKVLGLAVNAANEALRRRIGSEPTLAGMGSTLVAVLWSGSSAAIANIGDSRVYLYRGGRTRQITDDHVFGRLVADASRVPGLSERLDRFLDGRSAGRSADIITRSLRSGDRFLLCSDGLSSYVDHGLIHDVLNSPGSPDLAAERLVAAALEQGGKDNVTVAVADVRDQAS